MDVPPVGNRSASATGNVTADGRSGLAHVESGELRVLVPAVLGAMCVLGFAANAAAAGLLIGNARKAKLSLINALLLNLMLADGLLLAFAAPFKAAAAYSRAGWTLGWLVCRTSDWFVHACMAAKSYTVAVTAKACHRYAINPAKQVSFRTRSIAALLLSVWLLACALPVPHVLFATLRDEGRGLACVQLVPEEARSFTSFYATAYPLLAFGAPFSFALLYFWRARARCGRRCSNKAQNLRAQMRSRRLTLTLFGLTVTTAVMWMPHWVWWVWTTHGLESGDARAFPYVRAPVPAHLAVCAQLLVFAVSLVNPFIVLALSEEFRESYKGLWRRLTLRKQPQHQQQQTPKSGPHAPTAPKSPTPRPETSAHLPPPERAEKDEKQQQEEVEKKEEKDSPGNKEGTVLPDVEQFWHEREGGSHSQENDPVPWEHQNPKETPK
ncbi:G-protein coupled receptor 151 [Hoplias malabaricus]|uniref:G-protein coupled receptor 151 n=1 Tax=Hoplias malabaricus TaxID=27720 RepID=UPI003461AD0D